MSKIIRYRGDTAEDKVLLKNPSTGLPMDVTGHTFVMSVSTLTDVSVPLYTVAGVILSAAGGLIEFAPSAPQVDQVPGDYYYSIKATYPSGRTKTLIVGSLVYK